MKLQFVFTIFMTTTLAWGNASAQRSSSRQAPAENNAAQALIEAGDQLAEDNKWNEAIAAYRQALRIDPRSVEAEIHLGDAYMGASKWTEALVEYKKAAALGPQDADAQYALGDAYNTMGMHGDAFAPLVRAMQLDPTFAEAQYGIGYAYLKGSQYEKSLGFLKTAIHLKPDYDDAYYSLALAYLHLNNPNGVAEQRKKLVSLNSALVSDLDREIGKLASANTDSSTTAAATASSRSTQRSKGASTSGRLPANAFELSFWDSIKNSTDPEDFKAYLKKYPNGEFAELAKRRAQVNDVAPPSDPALASTKQPSEPAPALTRASSTPAPDARNGAYEDLISRANTAWNAQDSTNAVLLLRQAIEIAPTRAEAFQLLGTVQLYGNKDYPAATEAMRAAIERGGAASFAVAHDHDGTFQAFCQGSLNLTKTGIAYRDKAGNHSFQASYAEMQEARLNDFLGPSQAAFHIKITQAGKTETYLFAPGSAQLDESITILNLILNR